VVWCYQSQNKAIKSTKYCIRTHHQNKSLAKSDCSKQGLNIVNILVDIAIKIKAYNSVQFLSLFKREQSHWVTAFTPTKTAECSQGVMGNVCNGRVQMYCWVQQWKNFENWSTSAKVLPDTRVLVSKITFFTSLSYHRLLVPFGNCQLDCRIGFRLLFGLIMLIGLF